MTDTADTLFREMLECYLSAITVEIYSAISRSISVSWQRVICSAGIVAGTFAGILSEEHTTRIYNLLSHLLIILCLDDKMLWGIGIRECDGIADAAYQNQLRVLECLLGNLFTRQFVELNAHLFLNIVDNLI